MKRHIFIATILICFLLSGCSGENHISKQPNECAIETVKTEREEVSFETNTNSITEEKTYQAEANYTQILERYKTLYEAEDIYPDLYFDGKFLFVGKSSVVCLIVIGNTQDSTIISKQNIAKVDDFVSGEFGSITIYDKTGETVSIMVKPEETKEIISAIYGG